MKIYKDRGSVGNYTCRYDTKDPELGVLFAGGNSNTAALIRMFEKLKWAEIGNWKTN